MSSKNKFRKRSILYLPSYAPELNPLEQVWDLARSNSYLTEFMKLLMLYLKLVLKRETCSLINLLLFSLLICKRRSINF